MITSQQLGWLKEFLKERVVTDIEKESAVNIVTTFKDLWGVVKAARVFADPGNGGEASLKLQKAFDVLYARPVKPESHGMNQHVLHSKP